ncbi:MAG: ABC transporter permease [Planctomycetota bacterium]|nr:ABC transporter permease [Planctomycetota bacterium]
MRAVVAIAFKDLRLLLRDRGAAFFAFVFPLLLSVFFGAIFPGGGGKSGGMKIAVVDEDGTTASGEIVADLEKDSSLRVTRAPDRAAGRDLVRGGDVSACVIFPEGFGDRVDALFTQGTAEIEAIVEPGRAAEAGLLQGKLQEKAFQRVFGGFTDGSRFTGVMGRARDSLAQATDLKPESKEAIGGMLDSIEDVRTRLEAEAKADDAEKTGEAGGDAEDDGGFGGFRPVAITVEELGAKERRGPRSTYEVSFPQGVVWGLMGCTLAFGAGLATERSRGTLVRLTTAPISRGAILGGKALGCFIACLMVQALLMALGLALGVRVESWGNLAAAMLASAIGFSGLMMMMAGLCRTEAAARGTGQAVVLILAMIGGGTVPLFLLPDWAQTASSVSPFRWALLGVEGALWRDMPPERMALPVGVLLGLALIGFVVGVRTMRWSE